MTKKAKVVAWVLLGLTAIWGVQAVSIPNTRLWTKAGACGTGSFPCPGP